MLRMQSTTRTGPGVNGVRAALARVASLITLIAGLAGCASGPLPVDTRYRAEGQDSRVLFIVLHYTDEDFANSLKILTRGPVSSHYLVSDETPPRVYRLVDEDRRAWHAGVSSWQLHGGLNASSIGIEIVNLGREQRADGSHYYVPYPPAQIDAVVALVKDIMQRQGVRPAFVLGHSDIAPQRKVDPGPMFPWHRLAAEGLIPWPAPDRVAALQVAFTQRPPELPWFQRQLARVGYAVPQSGQLDEPTRRVIAAFQMKYRPARHDGLPDAETAALVEALLEATEAAPAPAVPPSAER
jgi:N-acetylmuramoyl-L-alanine amidase